MKKPNSNQSESNILRQKAEEKLKSSTSTKNIVERDNLKLIYELEVHQIELEMQNEELVMANQRAETIMDKYVDLYDFAPSGYLSLSGEGDIVNLNFSAAKILGGERSELKKKRLRAFVSPDSLTEFNYFFNNAYRYNKKQSCEIALISNNNNNNNNQIDVQLYAIVAEGSEFCLITMFDVTERKKTEEELRNTTKQLKELNRYFIDRELRMIDLKNEINELLIKSGCEKEYLL